MFLYSEDLNVERGRGKGSVLEERLPVETKMDELIKSIANWD